MRPATRIEPPRWMVAPSVRNVLEALADAENPARFVGGCVRDVLLERAAKDIDIATPLPPEEVMQRLDAAGIRCIATGLDHGTVTAIPGGGAFSHIEITTLREDVETDGRRARVAFTDDWEADAARRDFTINALFCDPDGTVYDPTGGLADLKAQRVRFVGDARQRIREDGLRLLRFFRFQALYGAAPADKEAVAACAELAPMVAGLSGERVAAELLKLLAAPEPAVVLSIMTSEGILRHVLGVPVFLDRLAALTEIDAGDPDPLRRLSAMLDVSGDEAVAVAEGLRLSNVQTRRLVLLAGAQDGGGTVWPEAAAKETLYRVGAAGYRDLVYRAWADAKVGGRCTGDADDAWRSVLALPERWPAPVLPVGGRDALAAGIPTGAAVGAALREVETWWVDGGFAADRAACVVRLGELATQSGPDSR